MARIENQTLLLRAVPTVASHFTEAQSEYLKMFREGKTIAGAAKAMLETGRLVCFNQMFELVQTLHERGLIQNTAFSMFFQRIKDCAIPAPKQSLFENLFKKEKPDSYLQRHPFFRAQNPVLTALFCQHGEVIDAKPGAVLCQAGSTDRDLFFVIDGEAAIYKKTAGQARKFMSFIGKDAVIGEVGFFMGEPRTADVVVTKAAKIVVVHYDEVAFGKIINKEIAQNLQTRFRVVHALTKSPFLKAIPEEAMDALVFAGKVRQVKEFEVLCQDGEVGDRCYIVIHGSVIVSKGPKTIGLLGPGETFGEIALFFTQGVRTATVMAQRETTVLEIKAQDFYRMLGENILLACEFEKLALERAQKMQQTA